MANALFDHGRNEFLNGNIDWVNDDIRAILVDDADYTLDLANHQNLDDVPAGARVGSAVALTGKTAVAGVADADDATFLTVAGDQAELLLIYLHTGVESTSTLIAAIDTATGRPVTPGGGNITITWDNGVNRIFKL